jgi:hypothetical protein
VIGPPLTKLGLCDGQFLKTASFTWGSKLQVLTKKAVSCQGFCQAQEKVTQRIDTSLRRTLKTSKTSVKPARKQGFFRL